MFFIDIAVPRDVDPEMNRVDGVFLYDIDDLQTVAASNMADRSREATSAERIITEEVVRFTRRASTLDVVPSLVGLQQNIELMRQAELRRAQVRLQGLTAEQHAAVEALTRGLANKFLHLPLQALRAAAQQGDAARLEMLRETFRLDPELSSGHNPASGRSELPGASSIFAVSHIGADAGPAASSLDRAEEQNAAPADADASVTLGPGGKRP
jgi:glutamyl-tRNA reductase